MKAKLPLMSAGFIVTGMSFDPNDCTLRFGVEPSEVLVKGEGEAKIRRPIPQSSWSVESKRERIDSTDKALHPVL